jgi:beta-ureidopropionase
MNNIVNKEKRLPREVWVAAISIKGLWPEKTIAKRMKDVINRMESLYAFEPDIICLPETVNISWVNEIKTLEEIAEDETTPGPVTSQFAEIAKRRNCYITCPIITKKDGHYYNSAVLINRKGAIDGVFHKIHPTDTEIIPDTYYKGGGITPGTLRPPVFKTDFGTIGIQICMDANWDDGWQSLKADGAEMVLFPSQASYENQLSNHAWKNKYHILSSTGEDARIIDFTGDTIVSDSDLSRWVCAPVNFEKEFVHAWPHVNRFDEIQKKYGRGIRIRIYHQENWATIESLVPEIKVKEILREYDIPTFDEQIDEATKIQKKYRV